MGEELSWHGKPVLLYPSKVRRLKEKQMKKALLMILLLILIPAVATGCARTKRIANDIDWVVFDGEPKKDN